MISTCRRRLPPGLACRIRILAGWRFTPRCIAQWHCCWRWCCSKIAISPSSNFSQVAGRVGQAIVFGKPTATNSCGKTARLAQLQAQRRPTRLGRPLPRCRIEAITAAWKTMRPQRLNHAHYGGPAQLIGTHTDHRLPRKISRRLGPPTTSVQPACISRRAVYPALRRGRGVVTAGNRGSRRMRGPGIAWGPTGPARVPSQQC